jgi:hypothetical protein
VKSTCLPKTGVYLGLRSEFRSLLCGPERAEWLYHSRGAMSDLFEHVLHRLFFLIQLFPSRKTFCKINVETWGSSGRSKAPERNMCKKQVSARTSYSTGYRHFRVRVGKWLAAWAGRKRLRGISCEFLVIPGSFFSIDWTWVDRNPNKPFSFFFCVELYLFWYHKELHQGQFSPWPLPGFIFTNTLHPPNFQCVSHGCIVLPGFHGPCIDTNSGVFHPWPFDESREWDPPTLSPRLKGQSGWT